MNKDQNKKQEEFEMAKESGSRRDSVEIGDLPEHSQAKVSKVKGQLKKGSYVLNTRVVDDKTVEGLLPKVVS